MRTHRAEANRRRVELNRRAFSWGPKVPDGTDKFVFDSFDTLEDHDSDEDHINPHPNATQKTSAPVFLPRNFLSDVQSLNSDAVNDIDGYLSPDNSSGFCENGGGPIDILSDQEQAPVAASSPHSPMYETHSEDRSNGESEGDSMSTVGSSRTQFVENATENMEEFVSVFDSTGSVHYPVVSGVDPLPDDEMSLMEDHQPAIYFSNTSSSSSASDVMYLSASEECHAFRYSGSRIPGLMQWIQDKKKLLKFFQKHGLEITAMEDLLEIVDAPCLTWSTVRNNMIHFSGLSECFNRIPICPGHMAFVDLTAEARDGIHRDVCSHCEALAPETMDDAKGNFRVIPLIPRIEAMVRDERSCRLLYEYRWNRTSDVDGAMRDYFDGEAYREIVSRCGGEEALKYDIFVGLSADGFQAFKNKRCDIWMVSALLFNLAPNTRYRCRNVLPLSYVPGPDQVKNMQSFLIPTVNEIWKTHANDVEMTFYDGEQRRVRIHAIFFGGDQQAICKCGGLVGYNGKMPCRNCKFKGTCEFSDRYYYPSRVLENGSMRILFDFRSLPLRPIGESYQMIDTLGGKTGADRSKYQRDTGIREDCVLFCMPGMDQYDCFPPDTMHTFQNVPRELLRLMLCTDYDDGFNLPPAAVSELDAEFCEWGEGISGQLAPRPRLLSKYKDWKASELKHFTLTYCLVLLDGYLPEEYLDGLQCFVEAVEICSWAVVLPSDVEKLRTCALKFYDHFESKWYRFLPERVNFCKSIFHALLHLAECMERYGPLSGVNQYWLERTIGWAGIG